MRKSRQHKSQPQSSSPPPGGGGGSTAIHHHSLTWGMPMIRMVWHQGNAVSSPSWNAHTRGDK